MEKVRTMSKLQVVIDGKETNIYTSDAETRRSILKELLTGFRKSENLEFYVKFDGQTICTSVKVFLAPAEVRSLYLLG